jgi:hypothetical protein
MNARQRLVDSIIETCDLDTASALELADALVKHKLVKLDAGVGQAHPIHGQIMERDTLLRVLSNLRKGEAELAAGRGRKKRKNPTRAAYAHDAAEDEARANPPTLEVVDTEEWDDGTVVEFVAVPFPYERKPLAYRDDPTAQGSVRLDELIATQRRVTKAGVEGAGDAPIRVYQTTDGRRYIADGHHRAVAAWAAGVEVLPAVIQLVRE